VFQLSQSFDRFQERWNALPRRTHELLPCRRDITPAHFGELIQNVGIAEAVGHLNMHVLYYGSGLERISGLKVTGRNYYDLLPSEFVKPMSVFHAYVLGTPCGAFVGDVVTTPSGSHYLYESLQYPLADDNGQARFLLVYGHARTRLDIEDERALASIGRANIKDMHYLDLGAGAPTARIEDFEFFR
jgi:hypothetical protein